MWWIIGCSSRCASCSSSSICDECVTGALYYNATCVASCPTTTYANDTQCSGKATFIVHTWQCLTTCVMVWWWWLACGLQCATCYNSTVCQYCIYPYVTYNGVCTAACPLGYFADGSRVCKRKSTRTRPPMPFVPVCVHWLNDWDVM